jgi:hypothetical protein
MLVLGTGMLPSTFSAEKSVCVSSVEAGPRSVVGGGRDLEVRGEGVERARRLVWRG